MLGAKRKLGLGQRVRQRLMLFTPALLPVLRTICRAQGRCLFAILMCLVKKWFVHSDSMVGFPLLTMLWLSS